MPNRILKESIKYCDQIDMLSAFDETVFYRLIVTVDDYGCYDGRIVLLKNELFPTRENITTKEIENTLMTLERVGLIKRYAVEGKPYIQLITWEKHQRVRNSVRKFPGPEDADDEIKANEPCGELRQVAASCGDLRQSAALIQSNPNPNPNPESNPNPTRTRAHMNEELVDESDLPEVAKEKLHEWVRYKAEKNERYKETGLKSLLKQVQKYIDLHGLDPVLDRIDTAMASGWKGMNLDSITANQKTRAAPGSADDYLMRVARGEA